MKKMFAVALGAFLAFFIVACGEKKMSSNQFEQLEEYRGTARANAEWNAKHYRATNPLLGDWDIVTRGDSSQTSECLVGDGWATIDMYPPAGGRGVQLKCSTVSSNVGCLLADDFKTKAYASEENSCQSGKLPEPLPKIAK
jgi:hypothetical protein